MGIFISLIVLYLFVIIFLPIVNTPKQPIEKIKCTLFAPPCRANVTYDIDGQNINSWLYLPHDSLRTDSLKQLPCIILSGGFCGTKDMLLEQYALKFVEAGFAAISLDYRHFGQSEGEPRQLYSETKQLEDIQATVEYARSRKEIDSKKLFLWGTSSSGGFGLRVAALDKEIAGVIGQTPAINAQADGQRIFERYGLLWLLKLLLRAQRDKGRSRF